MTDFSLKWFGIPDATIVAFWNKLDKLPKPSKIHREGWALCNCHGCYTKRYEKHAKFWKDKQ